ncbi:CpaF family protein [Candidatus Margulisiibacteriota bacterium]
MSLFDRLGKKADQAKKKLEEQLGHAQAPVDKSSAETKEIAPTAKPALASTAQVIENIEKEKALLPTPEQKQTTAPAEEIDVRKDFLDKALAVHRKLINESELDFNKFNLASTNTEEIKKITATLKTEILAIIEAQADIYSRKEKGDLVEAVINETVGLGPIEDLVGDDSVTEIMVNGANSVYVERKGKIEKTPIVFYDNEHVRRIILRIVNKIGRRIDEGMPMVDARLKDGSRVNAIIPPLALTGPTLTIRKFSKISFSSKDLVRFGSYSPAIEEFLKICVQAKMNVLVSGGTGSGKTTLLNVLSSFIPNDDRIVTIEDSAELRLGQDHVITLETRPPNIENTGEVTIRDLVRNSLRMRPDRLVVGEVRGGEALDMLQAMNTGHDGSMTTAHANTPRDLVSRLETMVLMAGIDIPVKAIRQQISSAFNIIIQQSRLQDGSRKIVKITELCGMEEDTVVLKDLFIFKQESFNKKTKKVEGQFTSTGLVPSFLQGLEAKGFTFPKGLFSPSG